MSKFWEKLHTHVKNTLQKKEEEVLNLHWAGGGGGRGLVPHSAKSRHVNPVEIPGILRLLPLVCSDNCFFSIFLTPAMCPGGVEECP